VCGQHFGDMNAEMHPTAITAGHDHRVCAPRPIDVNLLLPSTRMRTVSRVSAQDDTPTSIAC
jgi:hypothetical protein